MRDWMLDARYQLLDTGGWLLAIGNSGLLVGLNDAPLDVNNNFVYNGSELRKWNE